MSLRYKALIAVIVLVAFLTGFLVVSSSSLFEEDARARIERALEKDRGVLDERIVTSARISRTGMKASATSSELVQLFASEELQTIGDNLLPFAREWRRDADGDIAFAAIDSFVAQDRGANVLGHAGSNLSYVAVDSSETLPPQRRDALLKDPELNRFVVEFYDPAYEAGSVTDPDGESQAAVLPVAGRVYLAVQNFLWSSIQSREPVGVGIVLTELSRGWLKGTARKAATGGDDIGKIVFTADIIASSTLEDAQASETVFQSARAAGVMQGEDKGEPFQFELGDEICIGIAFNSGLSPKGNPNRPGFITFKSLDAELAPFKQLRERVFLIGGGLGFLAAVVAYFGAWLVIRQLRRLEDATLKIRSGNFDTRVNMRGRDELAKLGKAFNDMTTGLKALGMYTHDTLARSLLDNPELLNAPSMRAEGSIFFSDIKGFTSISEGLAAEALTSQLNEYFAAIGRKLKEQRGYVDKFIGDAIMAFWGPPFSNESDYAVRACASALASLHIATELRGQWTKQGKPLFYQRIGIATGEVVIGNIGTETKKNFTVIGDSVNLASRLEGANKFYLTEVLVDERTFELAKHAIAFREIDQIRVVGRQQPVRVFEPRVAVTSADEAYARALKHYRGREFGAAIGILDALLQAAPDDGPAQWLREQCRALQDHLPPGWEPVTTATSK